VRSDPPCRVGPQLMCTIANLGADPKAALAQSMAIRGQTLSGGKERLSAIRNVICSISQDQGYSAIPIATYHTRAYQRTGAIAVQRLGVTHVFAG
jgi:hypothetical protein